MSDKEEEGQRLLPRYQEIGVELKDLSRASEFKDLIPTSELTTLVQGSSRTYQKLVVKYRWIQTGSPDEFRKLSAEFYLDSTTPLEDAVEFALANSPVPLTGADWSHKVILSNSDTQICVSQMPISVVFPEILIPIGPAFPQTDEESKGSTIDNERALHIVSDVDYYKKEAERESRKDLLKDCKSCIMVGSIAFVSFVVSFVATSLLIFVLMK